MLLGWIHINSWYDMYWWLSVIGWVFAGVFFLFLLAVLMFQRRAHMKDTVDEAKQ
jgi:cbb3-type cytochrome oxidase subunit 3